MAKKKSVTKTPTSKKSRKSASDASPTTAFTAFVIGDGVSMPIEPGSATRDWMEETRFRYAYRCLPLVIANQNGWVIQSPFDFTTRWNGGPLAEDIKIKGPKDFEVERYITSHFGHGVLTFRLPYLFRTPPSISLWVKGASNWIKDGIQALEGVVETDWLESTFTMNWKFTRKNATIKFQQGEPICMIVPVARGLAESLVPATIPISENSELAETYDRWRNERVKFNDALARGEPEAVELGWQRDYMLGRRLDGSKVESHQTKVQLRSFPKTKPTS